MTSMMFDEAWLRELDKRRQDEPRKVNRTLEKALASAPVDLVSEILLVYGATFRQMGKVDAARWSYFEGYQLAKRANDRVLQALFRQRQSWVEFLDGKFSFALDLLRIACGTFSELGEQNRKAKALVDIALQYNEREMFPQAITCADEALAKLDLKEVENRFSAFLVLAIGYEALGNANEALANLEAARAEVQHCSKVWKIRFAWTEAKIKKALLPTREVSAVYSEAAEFFLESGEILASAIATLEFARCEHAAGNFVKVQKIARSLRVLAFKAEGKMLTGVLLAVYREGLESKVSDRLLKKAIRSLVRARNAPSGKPRC